MTINAQPYQIEARDAVDIVGRSFAFTHHKGIVEWVKNSWDAYQRRGRIEETDDMGMVLEFRGRGQSFREVLMIDWCGASSDDITQSFMKWFDMAAATRNAGNNRDRILGGHGNVIIAALVQSTVIVFLFVLVLAVVLPSASRCSPSVVVVPFWALLCSSERRADEPAVLIKTPVLFIGTPR